MAAQTRSRTWRARQAAAKESRSILPCRSSGCTILKEVIGTGAESNRDGWDAHSLRRRRPDSISLPAMRRGGVRADDKAGGVNRLQRQAGHPSRGPGSRLRGRERRNEWAPLPAAQTRSRTRRGRPIIATPTARFDFAPSHATDWQSLTSLYLFISPKRQQRVPYSRPMRKSFVQSRGIRLSRLRRSR